MKCDSNTTLQKKSKTVPTRATPTTKPAGGQPMKCSHHNATEWRNPNAKPNGSPEHYRNPMAT
jgi:hypothetical protein